MTLGRPGEFEFSLNTPHAIENGSRKKSNATLVRAENAFRSSAHQKGKTVPSCSGYFVPLHLETNFIRGDQTKQNVYQSGVHFSLQH